MSEENQELGYCPMTFCSLPPTRPGERPQRDGSRCMGSKCMWSFIDDESGHILCAFTVMAMKAGD
jgi:hypothetical protein